MLGRQVSSLLRQPLHARLAAATSSHCLCIRTLSTSSPFAGAAASRPASRPSRPKKAVGEPSKPVKRAVKRTARKPTSEASEPAAKKVAAKKTTAAKKKAAKPKAKPAPKPKTPEQLARIRAQRAKLENKELKAAALSPPKLSGTSAYLEFQKTKSAELSEKLKARQSPADIKTTLAEHSKGVAAAWKESTPADVEHYNHLAHTAKEAAQAEYKRWVESHTAEEIQIANTARASLRRRETRTKRHSSKWPAIDDERRPARNLTAFLQFSVNRNASGDFTNISVAERAKLIGQEWKALDAEEKKKYQNLSTADSKRYAEEYKTVYGHAPSGGPLYGETHTLPQQAAAA